MIVYRVEIPPHVAAVIRHLSPDLKRSVKAALRVLSAEPDRGIPLLGALEAFRKYRVRRFRIIYFVDRAHRVIKVFAIGHRRGIYEEVVSSLRPESQNH